MNKSEKHIAILWLALGLAAAAQGQTKTSRELDHSVGVLDSGVTLQRKTMLEPGEGNSTSQNLGGGVFRASGNTMQHCLYDRGSTIYFGYSMTVLPGLTTDTRKVVFAPVDVAGIRDGLQAVAGDQPLNAAPAPKYPPPQTVHNGDTIAMDLMTSSDGNERIVDYIRFSFGKNASQPLRADAAPQDFTIDDGSVEIDLGPPTVAVDGKNFDGPVIVYPSQGGRTLWAYFPGQGRFVLSLMPRAQMTKGGSVRGNRIVFASNGHEYEIRLTEPMAGVDKAWNLYVTRDPLYLPRPALVNAVVVSADRLDNLVAK